MGFLAPLASGGGLLSSLLGGGLLGGIGSLLGIGKKKPPMQTRPVTRDAATEQAEASDALQRRRGAAADMITGTRGAEAAASSVGRLVVGS